MFCYYNPSTDAYYNLALEQAMMDAATEDVFMLWQNDRAVIIGKNQNAAAEVDRAYCESRGIKVVRRLTGGGAVYHDLGNVNYTFITSAGEGGLDFERFARPVVGALAALGVDAALTGRNDIEAAGMKISGNAQCVREGRLLHHGTLLYDADLGALSSALKVSPDKIVSKGVKSVRNRVGNIKDIGSLKLSVPEFITHLMTFIRAETGCDDYTPTAETSALARQLAKERYSRPEWNYGAYHAYNCINKKRFDWGGVEVCFDVTDGRISSLHIYGDYFEISDTAALASALEGVELSPEALSVALETVDVAKYIRGASNQDILGLFV